MNLLAACRSGFLSPEFCKRPFAKFRFNVMFSYNKHRVFSTPFLKRVKRMGFTFVDRIIEMKPGKSIRAKKHILENEEIFEVHYPGFPAVPGTFLTEMMAQTAGKCLDAEKKPRGMAMLARIKSAAFRQYVGPSKTLVISGEIVNNRSNVATAVCTIEMENKKICTAELLFAFVAFDKLDPAFRDEVLESYLSKNSGQGDF